MAAEGRCTIDEFMHLRLSIEVLKQNIFLVRSVVSAQKECGVCCLQLFFESGEQQSGQRRICGRTLNQETTPSCLNNFLVSPVVCSCSLLCIYSSLH